MTIRLLSVLTGLLLFLQPVLAQNTFTVSQQEEKPLVISIENLSSTEVKTVRPYSTDLNEVKNELEIYRWMYIPFALFQGYVLIGAAVRR